MTDFLLLGWILCKIELLLGWILCKNDYLCPKISIELWNI